VQQPFERGPVRLLQRAEIAVGEVDEAARTADA
jgi:hypothetical protein